MNRHSGTWSQWFAKWLPDRHNLKVHPWLQPIAARLFDLQLWRFQNEAVARGVAIGTFWAFAIPVGQTFVSMAHCVWMRGNIPVAVAMTMVTNPLTIGFWLWLAYQVGSYILGESASQFTTQGASIAAWLAEYGWPTLLGMALFAVGGAALGYLSVKLIGRLQLGHKRSRRSARAANRQ